MSRNYPPNLARQKVLAQPMTPIEDQPVSHELVFTSSQVMRLIPDLTYRMLDYWSRIGVLEPSVQSARGSGTPRAYSFLDVVALRAIVMLRSRGLTLNACRDLAIFVQKLDIHTTDLDSALVVVTSNEITLMDGTKISGWGSDTEPMGWILDLGAVIRTLRERIEDQVATIS